jgi:hypothetical protein
VIRRLPTSRSEITAEQFRDLVRNGMSEAEFQTEVLHEAKRLGWWCFVVPRNVAKCPRCGSKLFKWTNPGWPDLVLLRLFGPPRLMVRELKTNNGNASGSQNAILHTLRAAGVDADIWRPRDWVRIERELAT